jgi:hypothetical protein
MVGVNEHPPADAQTRQLLSEARPDPAATHKANAELAQCLLEAPPEDPLTVELLRRHEAGATVLPFRKPLGGEQDSVSRYRPVRPPESKAAIPKFRVKHPGNQPGPPRQLRQEPAVPRFRHIVRE